MESIANKKPKLKRELTFVQLIIIGTAGALGNGALFGAVGMVTVAGPGAIYAFLFGGLIYFSIALTYMELSRVHPEPGAPTRFSLYSHGRVTSLINSFADIVWYIFIPPLEALSIVAGIDYFMPGVLLNSAGDPTGYGVLVGVALVLAFAPFNYFGIGKFGRSTKWIGAVKLFFYVSMALGLIFIVHNFNNLSALKGGVLPYGPIAILLIMPLTMYDFGGIRVIPDLAGETRDDHIKKKDAVVKAVALTVVFETLIYISIAFAIIYGTNWSALGLSPGTWSGVKGAVGGANPFFVLTSGGGALGIVFIFAIIAGVMAPFVTGYIYTGAGARILFSTGRSGFINSSFTELHKRYSVPFWALIAFAIIGAVTVMIAAPAPNVYSVIVDATVAGYLGFSTHPPAMLVQRRQGITKKEQQFRGGWIFGPIAMGVSSLIVYWSGWPSVPYAMVLILLGSVIFGAIFRVGENFKNSIWYIVYYIFLLLMILFSKDVGPGTWTLFGTVYNVAVIPFTWGTLGVFLVVVFGFLPWAYVSGLKEEYRHEKYTVPFRAPVEGSAPSSEE